MPSLPSWPDALRRALRRLAPRYPDGVEADMLRSHFIYAVAYRADMPSLTPQQWIAAFEETLAPFMASGEIIANEAGRLLEGEAAVAGLSRLTVQAT